MPLLRAASFARCVPAAWLTVRQGPILSMKGEVREAEVMPSRRDVLALGELLPGACRSTTRSGRTVGSGAF